MGGYGAMKLIMKYPELFGSVSSMSAPLVISGLEALLPFVFAENNFTPGDTAAFYSIEPSLDKVLTSMMFAMGAAFTPHDHFNPDTSYFHRILDVPLFVGVDLPFNASGVLDTLSTVWQGWLANDPLTILTIGGGAAALTDKPIYLDCGDSEDVFNLGLRLQNQGFAQALDAFGIDYTYIEYSGYSENDAGHSNYVATRLREILKFHSEVFSSAE